MSPSPLRSACAALLLAVLGASPLRAADAPLVSVPRYSAPGAGQVFYFVLTDRFANGDPSNDDGGLGPDPSVSGFDPTRISHYHGGDLKGLTAKLDYIRGLGTTALWITPPFKNRAMQESTAGYHGYWILDFLHVDPHLGTDADLHELVKQAHARNIKVFLDIVVNHTADVITYRDGSTEYIDLAHAPYRDATGKPFDVHAAAYNGLNSPDLFPKLAAARSFPHVPVVAPEWARARNPDWLNDVTLYHNRGNSRFEGENSLFGDFAGLDDVFTESPRVVKGFIEVYEHWIKDYDIDGYRIDTVRHVNLEFWQAFGPAIHAFARQAGHPDFFMFGEVADGTGDAALMSEFANSGTLDSSLDFRFQGASRQYVSRGGKAADLAAMFAQDDYFTFPDRNAYSLPTFISNHDAGRIGTFLREDNAGITPERQLALEKLDYSLLYLVRGQPILYYGDEQGMTGIGDDMGAREDMFASRADRFKDRPLLGTTRTGADDKFDPSHPLYLLLKTLASFRLGNPAIARGAMLERPSDQPEIFAFSRIERGELVEYLAAFNNSRTATLRTRLATSQPAGALLKRVFDLAHLDLPPPEELAVGSDHAVPVSLGPLECAVWKAEAPLADPGQPTSVALVSPAPGATLTFASRHRDGHTIVVRQPIEAKVFGGDGLAEVTFVLQRSSRPGQYELLGTDDNPPYRVLWRPPSDLAPGEILTFIATVDDLRGHRSSAAAGKVAVAPSTLEYGIVGAQVPTLTKAKPFAYSARGTEPLDYQWFQNGLPIPGATSPFLDVAHQGGPEDRSFLIVSNREGTVISK